jgi:Protein of unknown function (DUF1045)
MLSKLDDSALTDTALIRCAVYWVPCRGHPLWRAGCEWLGRDPEPPRVPVRLAAPHELTREPRRYGFHATLKAPMRLREGRHIDAFSTALATLASAHEAFVMPTLELGWLSNFLALRPSQEIEAAHPLRCLADACVRSLETWREPLTAAESARHAARAGADDVERRKRTQRWGYPYVFDHWRFHLTLSIPLPEYSSGVRRSVEALAREHFAPALAVPLMCDELALFVEPAAGDDFVLVQRFRLRAATR